MPFPDHLTRDQAREWIRDLADLSWPVIFTNHAEYRSETRRVDQREVIRALMRGSIVSDPAWDADHRDFKVSVEAVLSDVRITVHAAIGEERPNDVRLYVVSVVANDI